MRCWSPFFGARVSNLRSESTRAGYIKNQMIEENTEAGLSFDELDLAPEVLHAVRDAGYTHPTPIQQQAIPLALAGRDLIGLAQTGTGKTARFPLPNVHNLISAPLTSENGEPVHRVRVLILTPTREL